MGQHVHHADRESHLVARGQDPIDPFKHVMYTSDNISPEVCCEYLCLLLGAPHPPKNGDETRVYWESVWIVVSDRRIRL
jgi:hypothetical protein